MTPTTSAEIVAGSAGDRDGVVIPGEAGRTVGAGVAPDVVTLAKPIAAGLPMGVTVVRRELAETLVPGDHGSTFAGGPLACRAALVLLDALGEVVAGRAGERLTGGLRPEHLRLAPAANRNLGLKLKLALAYEQEQRRDHHSPDQYQADPLADLLRSGASKLDVAALAAVIFA